MTNFVPPKNCFTKILSPYPLRFQPPVATQTSIVSYIPPFDLESTPKDFAPKLISLCYLGD